MGIHRQGPLQVGLIGTGRHGSRYGDHITADLDGLNLAAICRRSPEVHRQADQWGCNAFTDWRALIDDPGVECVIAVLPPMLNLKVAAACAEAGKPLLLEKPLAGTYEDARQIIALAEDPSFLLTTGQTLRYNAVIQTLRSHFHRLGRLYTFSANQRLEPSTISWMDDPSQAGAGVAFHTTVHVVDALRYITGLEVERVAATARGHGSRLEDVLVVLVEMEHGVVGTVDTSKIGNTRSGLFEFVGENCQLRGEQVFSRCEVIQGREVTDISPAGPVNTIVPLLREWERFVRGQGSNPVSGREGMEAVRICEACLVSAREKRWVDVR